MTKECIFCRRPIEAISKFCRYCGRDQTVPVVENQMHAPTGQTEYINQSYYQAGAGQGIHYQARPEQVQTYSSQAKKIDVPMLVTLISFILIILSLGSYIIFYGENPYKGEAKKDISQALDESIRPDPSDESSLLGTFGSKEDKSKEDEGLSGQWQLEVSVDKITENGQKVSHYDHMLGKETGSLIIDLEGKEGRAIIKVDGQNIWIDEEGKAISQDGGGIYIETHSPGESSGEYNGIVKDRMGVLTLEGDYNFFMMNEGSSVGFYGTWSAEKISSDISAAYGDSGFDGDGLDSDPFGDAYSDNLDMANPSGFYNPNQEPLDLNIEDLAGFWYGSAKYTNIEGFKENEAKLLDSGMPETFISDVDALIGTEIEFSLYIEEDGYWAYDIAFVGGSPLDTDALDFYPYEDYLIRPQGGRFKVEDREMDDELGEMIFLLEAIVFERDGPKIMGKVIYDIGMGPGVSVRIEFEFEVYYLEE